MTSQTTAPSGYALEKAMSIAMETVAGLEAEGVDTDERELRIVLADAGADVAGIVLRLLRAADEAGLNADGLAKRMDNLACRKERFDRRHTKCRAAVLSIIEALPTVFPDGKYAGAEFSASVRHGTAKPLVTDLTALPMHCIRVTKSPDMAEIRAQLKLGDVPGVTMSNGPSILTVRTK